MIRSYRATVGVLLGALAAVVLSVTLAPPVASAARVPGARRFHVALIKSEPALNDTLAASPASIKLWFSESVQAAVTGMRLTGPGNRAIAVGDVHVAAAPKSPAVAMISRKLTSGAYTVAWKTMAEDGHPASGTFTFVVRQASK
ncbi:MAG TPA: copper resistance CopC family protein [Gemmatimonadaceae bacterium]|jgi:copper transport protein|nr:copper resistance CopC family protein [Gemmatimonadaceae bacterium]